MDRVWFKKMSFSQDTS